MSNKEIGNKLEEALINVNNIPVVGYDNCIKVAKTVALLLEVQREISEKEETEVKDTE